MPPCSLLQHILQKRDIMPAASPEVAMPFLCIKRDKMGIHDHTKFIVVLVVGDNVMKLQVHS